MSKASPVHRLLSPRSVAVFGASDRTLVQRTAIQNVTGGSPEWVVGVNPGRRMALDLPCVESGAELVNGPDVALMLVPDSALERAVDEALAARARVLVVPGLTLGPVQHGLARRIADRVRRAGADFVGPNCMGIAVPGETSSWIGTIPQAVRRGPVAVVTESGAVAEAIVGLGPRLGLRAVASVGCEGTIGVSDLCEYFAEDEHTRVVGVFLETLGDPERASVVFGKLREAGKPLVCLKVGRSSTSAPIVGAHSGACVADWETDVALLERAGVICVDDYGEFVETLALLEVQRRPKGVRVGAITNSGGQAALLADHADRAGVVFEPLPDAAIARLNDVGSVGLAGLNPLDAWRAKDARATYEQAAEILASTGVIDVLLAVVDQSPFVGEMERINYRPLAQAIADQSIAHSLPAVVVSTQAAGLDQALGDEMRLCDVPVLQGILPALRAVALVARWSATRATQQSTTLAQSRAVPARSPASRT